MKKYVIGAVLAALVVASVFAEEVTWQVSRTIVTADLGANVRLYDTAYVPVQTDFEVMIYRLLDVLNQDTVLTGESTFVYLDAGRVPGEAITWTTYASDTLVYNSSAGDTTFALDSLDLDAATLNRASQFRLRMIHTIELDALAADTNIVGNTYTKTISVPFMRRY